MSVEQVENAASAIAIPFTYGNVAIQIGKQKVGTANEHSHKWTMFLRGAANQDLSYAVSKVVFTLHPDFANHIRGVSTRMLAYTPMLTFGAAMNECNA